MADHRHRNRMAASIEQEIRQLPPLAPERSIHRVPTRLHKVNPIAYSPQVISIGPLHHGRRDLAAAEEYKLRYLCSFLRRINMKIEPAIEIARSWEKRARNYYAEPITMNSDDFVKMILVDGCFIVELMMRCCDKFPPIDHQDGFDPLFFQALSIDLNRDLTMLENQLPFFIPQGLYDLHSPAVNNISFRGVTHSFFTNGLIEKCDIPDQDVIISNGKVNHLVDFLRFYYLPSAPYLMPTDNSKVKFELPPPATELQAAGITLKAANDNDKPFMDIFFRDDYGDLEIPPLKVDDGFETYLRNLVAYEHYRRGNGRNYAIHYVAFLDGLINTERDVGVLVKAGIIINHMGSDEKVANLFNELCRDVSITGDEFYFNKMCVQLHEHCRKRQNRWMASLRRDYFNTPWALVSFFAAALLILLTFLQTIFSAVSLSN